MTCVSTVALLYEKLNAVKRKRDALKEEVERETRETPAEEKERLLRQADTFNFTLFIYKCIVLQFIVYR
jgi:FtsZ-binding cell division protein ZapB